MQASTPAAGPVEDIKQKMRGLINVFRIEEAETLFGQLVELHGVDPEADDMLPSRVTIDVLSGRLRDTMCMLNGLGDDRALGLKAVCLRLMGDPFWEGLAAQAQAATDDPALKASMQTLIDSAEEA